MITFVTWLWNTPRYRSTFTPEHVQALLRMVSRHYPAAFRFVCVANDVTVPMPGVEIVADRADFATIASPHGGPNPSCYRRLRMYAPDAAAIFGERVVSLDLDCVITGDLRPLLDRPESFVGWQDPFHPRQICGSMQMLTTGAHAEVWDRFDPATSPQASLAAGYKGSDQGWISYCLPNAAQWTRAGGVLSYRVDCKAGLPGGSRIVFFHGAVDPWSHAAQQHAWVREHYR